MASAATVLILKLTGVGSVGAIRVTGEGIDDVIIGGLVAWPNVSRLEITVPVVSKEPVLKGGRTCTVTCTVPESEEVVSTETDGMTVVVFMEELRIAPGEEKNRNPSEEVSSGRRDLG